MSDCGYFDFPVDTTTSIPQSGITCRSPGSRQPSQVTTPQLLRQRQHSNEESSAMMRQKTESPQLSTTFGDISLREGGSRFVQRDVAASSERFISGIKSTTGSHQLSVAELANLIKKNKRGSILLLDLRGRTAYEKSRIKGAVNIPIPAILFKRPLNSIEKVAEMLHSSKEKAKLLSWSTHDHIIVYDNDSFNVGPTTPLYQSTMKFSGGQARTYTLKGGFAAVQRDAAHLIDLRALKPEEEDSIASSEGLPRLDQLSCALPDDQGAINPFFNNIRQNQDLIGGVGPPIEMQAPDIDEATKKALPIWLVNLAYNDGGAQRIADRFYSIEKDEQDRMLNVLKQGTEQDPSLQADAKHSIAAGVERGDKNRYNNIWPFENARVRLQDKDKCDYINASYIHASSSNRHYIATQGPLPGTTRDFWQTIWENDVSTIMMLTSTSEGGQTKCHAYWTVSADTLQPFALELLDTYEKDIRSTKDSTTHVTVRKFHLSNSQQKLHSAREVTQIQFSSWPDFHVIEPAAILGIILEMRAVQEDSNTHTSKRRKSLSAAPNQQQLRKPIVAHCSAGCGRTGVLCTIDTVLDLIENGQGEASSTIDLIEQTVREFRDQRMSMVQTLRQFVLCYDAVLLHCIEIASRRQLQISA